MFKKKSVDMLTCNLLLLMTSSFFLYVYVHVCVHTYNLYFITIVALFKFHVFLKCKIVRLCLPI